MSDDPNAPWAARPKHIQRNPPDPRNGKVWIYFRPPGGRKTPLVSAWGTQAMADEVAVLAAAIVAKPAPAIGTLAQAVRQYRGDRARGIEMSAAYRSLSPATQLRYDVWLDRFETAGEKLLLEDIDAAFILNAQDKWAHKGHEAANTALQVMKNVCKRPVILGQIPADPFTMIDRVARPQGRGIRNPRWEDVEVDAVLEYALRAARPRPGFARAIALGRWGGFRRQTICRVPLRARIERANGEGVLERRILWLTEKKEVLCDRREDLRLTELLGKTANKALTIAYNSHGDPWKPRALNHELDRIIALLAKRGEVRDCLTIHGLRHARGVEVAYMGGADAEIMAALDHATAAAAKDYRAQADRLRLADHLQDRVDAEVIRLRKTREKRGQPGET